MKNRCKMSPSYPSGNVVNVIYLLLNYIDDNQLSSMRNEDHNEPKYYDMQRRGLSKQMIFNFLC